MAMWFKIFKIRRIVMMRKKVLKRAGLVLSALFLVTALGLAGCASEQQIKADREAAELAAKKAEEAAAQAEAAANRSEAAANQANAAAAKCVKTFEKGLRK
jgi:preprotein translocase subunit SecG